MQTASWTSNFLCIDGPKPGPTNIHDLCLWNVQLPENSFRAGGNARLMRARCQDLEVHGTVETYESAVAKVKAASAELSESTFDVVDVTDKCTLFKCTGRGAVRADSVEMRKCKGQFDVESTTKLLLVDCENSEHAQAQRIKCINSKAAKLVASGKISAELSDCKAYVAGASSKLSSCSGLTFLVKKPAKHGTPQRLVLRDTTLNLVTFETGKGVIVVDEDSEVRQHVGCSIKRKCS